MATRLTMAQALIRFLGCQHVERDGVRRRFFGGVWGIFGHGNVAGIGQALQQQDALRYLLSRNEQAMVHASVAYSKLLNRMGAMACTSSIGPGATNMVTGAATATINRIPVLLLPGDIFARRNVAPVLQQLECERSADVSVNDCFRPVSRYWDRINRADQLPFALLEAMRVLTSPADTGAVTLSLPQDVQAEAHEYPSELFEERVWTIPRPLADRNLLARAMQWLERAETPLVIAGGGVHYSEATEALRRFAEKTGIPVAETQAGKGALPFDHPANLGALGVTGVPPANRAAREADLVLCVGTRLSDFTTASKTAFRHPDVRFVAVNVNPLDAFKQAALPLVGDARATLEELVETSCRVRDKYRGRLAQWRAEWREERARVVAQPGGRRPLQAAVIGVVNDITAERDVVVCAAGSLPGDLHKLWQTRDPRGYHLEYGYSCMGYEIAGGLGARLADPGREVYVMVGDGSYLMMASEIATAVQEGIKLNVVVLDNQGFGSIGGLSASLGSEGFGTHYRARDPKTGRLDGAALEVDFAANAASLGALARRVEDLDALREALLADRNEDRPCVTVIPVERESGVPSYESWWDVPVAETSEMKSVRRARAEYEKALEAERFFGGETSD